MSLGDLGIFLLITLPVFFLVRWLLRNKNLSKRASLIWSAAVGILAYPVIVYGLIMGYFTYKDRLPNRAFDRSEWLADPTKRYEMQQDLLAGKKLEGKTKTEVCAMIGLPDNQQDTSKNSWRYTTGMSSAGFGVQIHSLHLKFANGRFLQAEIFKFLD